MPKGKLIIIDGFDGVGKSTQIQMICDRFYQEGSDLIKIKFPNYESPSSYLVKEYLNGNIYNSKIHENDLDAVKGICMTYAIDRHYTWYSELNGNRLIDLLNTGYDIICDRYSTSNMIIQGSKFDNNEDAIKLINFIYDVEYRKMNIPEPDAVLILTMPLNRSIQLLEKTNKKLDIHETIQFQQRCHNFFNKLTTLDELKYITNNWKIINCYDYDKESILPTEIIHEMLYNKIYKMVSI